MQGLFDAAEAIRGAATEFGEVIERFGGLITSLGILINNTIVAVTDFDRAIEDGTLQPSDTTSLLALPPPVEAPVADVMDVNIANPTDIYDPARIEELRSEGFNNREIGQILRETAQQDVAPTSPSSEALEQAVSQSGPVPVHVVNIADLNVAVENMVSVEEHTGIVPIGVPVGGPESDNRLFHFAETDAIANRLARSASLNRPRPAPYFPTQDQIRNAKDVSREIVQGFVEGMSQRNSGFVGEGAREQPQTIVIENKMQMPSGVVKEISRERIILNEQGDFLDV